MPITAKTYNPILTKGVKSNLGTTAIHNGKIRFTTDTGELFVDDDNKRVQINDVIKGYTQSEIEALQNPLSTKFYFSSDTHLFMYYANNEWSHIAVEAESAAGLSVVNGRVCITYQVNQPDLEPEEENPSENESNQTE